VNLARKDPTNEIGEALYEEALKVASGKQTKAEILDQSSYNGIFIIGPLA